MDTHLKKCDALQIIQILSSKPHGKCRPDDLVSLFFLFLFQVVTSFIEALCPLGAWCMKVNSPQSNLLWICMMRTKPDLFKWAIVGHLFCDLIYDHLSYFVFFCQRLFWKNGSAFQTQLGHGIELQSSTTVRL